MDITVTQNPYQNNNVLSDGTFRVAKLNNDTKRPHIARYWEMNLPRQLPKQEEKKETVSNIDYNALLNRLGIIAMESQKEANVNGFRKLKVNNIVREKTLKAYENSDKEELTIVENKEQVFEAPKVEVAPTPAPSIIPQEEKNEMPIRGDGLRRQEFTNTFPESRMSRLEKTEEVPKINVNNDLRVQQMNYDERPNLSRVERRMNDDYQNMEMHSEKVEVGKGEKDLNRIQAFSPLGNGSKNNMSELQEAYNKAFDNYAVSEKRKKDSREEVIALERQIQEAKELLEEKHKKQIAELNARTRANEEETLGYTMHSEDLRAQLEELRAQLNSGTMRR